MIGFLKAVIAWAIFLFIVAKIYPDCEACYVILGTAMILAGAVANNQ